MFPKLIFSAIGGLRTMWAFIVVGAIIAFYTAPSFLGVVFITASVIGIVKVAALIGFAVGTLIRFMLPIKVAFAGKEEL
jgi:hypothetical protein